jgi:hypothetical protein
VNCLIEAGEEFIYAQSSKLRHKSEKLHWKPYAQHSAEIGLAEPVEQL